MVNVNGLRKGCSFILGNINININIVSDSGCIPQLDDESLKKALRIAMLKRRFADTIKKANVMRSHPSFSFSFFFLFLPPPTCHILLLFLLQGDTFDAQKLNQQIDVLERLQRAGDLHCYKT